MQRPVFFEQFQLHAGQRADHTAIDADGGSTSYVQLEAESNRIAAALLRAGLRPRGGDVVALMLPPGARYVAALLGVAKAGAAFMPLPADLPPARQRLFLHKARCRFVLTQQEHRSQLDPTGPPKVLVPADWEGEDAATSPGVAIAPTDPCYVMFTSGSTGEPKAVLGSHRGLSHFLRWELAELGLDAAVRGSWLAPITFDVSLRDILVPLMAGGTVCVPPQAVRTQPHRLLQWLADHQVTLIHCVPTLLRLLNRSLAEQPRAVPVLPALRHLLVAGEPLLACDVAAWRRLSGSAAETLNLYGPSETTLAKLFLRVGETSEADRSVLPIGRPLPNTVVHILDDQRPCAPGEVGEICIATPYRSLGYLNDPDLTAAAFVRNPLGTQANDVIYRSGDLGRLLPDGTVQCLGRQDGQVKLNGVRIELAEIEAVLRLLPGVDQCACSLHRLSTERAVLVAYYSQPPGQVRALDETRVRAHLEAHLPQAMLPQRIMRLASIPTTVSGKVNRNALPKPAELYYGDGEFVAPATPTESGLAGIWADLLELEAVGVCTDFQVLGGDSLRAIRALMRIHQTFGVDVTLKDFYRLGTVRLLAGHVDALLGRGAVARIPRAATAPADPASPGQERLWRLDRMGIAPTAYNLPAAFEVLGDLDVDRLEEALRRVVGRHESLRTVFAEVDGRARLRVLDSLDPTVRRVDLRRDADADARAVALALEDESTAFDLGAGPLLRLMALRMPPAAGGQDRHLLLFNIHHIVSDVWSLGVLARELGQAYDALGQGADPGWAPLPVQQRDVTAWQAARLQEEPMQAARSYWHDRFAQPPAPLDLPSDRPRPATQTFGGATRRRRLPSRLLGSLDRLAQERRCTLFVLLQALVKVQLFRYSGQRDLVIGSPVAGRDHPDLQDQIGYLVNVLALRDRVDPEQPFDAFLDAVGRTTRDALNHQAYPFDLLVAGLALPRDMSRSPLFDVMVVVDAFEPSLLSLHGAQVRPWRDENAWNFSRFDLVFHFQREHDELVLDLNYNSDLFDQARIDRACLHLEALAEAVAAAPGTTVGDLELLAPGEREALRAMGTGAALTRPDVSLPVMFAQVAARHPDRVAVMTRAQHWSYAEFAADAAQVAVRLREALGLSAGDRVGVWARRSYGSLVAMLGAMAAGAVYVPLDPAYPRERLDLLLRRAGCSIVLADNAEDAAQAATFGTRTLALDEWLGAARIAARTPGGDAMRLPAPPAASPAYMIFTSGSTGVPKGVLCRHDALVNMSLGQIEAFGLTEHDRVMQFASPSFDASLANVFMAWLCGGAVVLPDAAALESADGFLEAVAATRTTVATLPPSFLRALDRAPMPGVRVLIAAGEPAVVTDMVHHAATLSVFNAYGPTEATVCATVHRVRPEDAARPRIPIGVPLPNLRLRVVDDRGHLAPVGVTGRLLIGGAGVAEGYFGDEGLTRERFIVPDPASGDRFYDSGDRVRWQEDGTLDFLGRDDDQVKVSGHRIELGEVEHALRQCADVADAAVVPVTRPDGSTALAAYFCQRPRTELWPSVAEFYVYDDVVYGSMANDAQRNARYLGAFSRHLRGKVVLDIGTGPFAILSRLAIEAGAAHVYAVDLLPATAERARQTVQRLGLADRITVLQGDARTIELPQQADVCISEIVGAIGGSEGAAEIINRARRLLRDPSAMLPQRSVTRLAAVNLPEGSFDWGFSDVAAHYVERIFAEVGHPFDLRLCVKNLPRDAIVSSVGVLEDLDYTRPVPLVADHEDVLEIRHAGPVTGLLAWLQLHVDADHVVDILENPASWLPVYIPVDLGGRTLAVGDRLALTVSRTLAHNGLNPDFRISGRLLGIDGSTQAFAAESLHFGGGFRRGVFHQRLFGQETVPRARRLTAQDVRAQVACRLPPHAVPAYVMEVERLPTTVSGKIDRRALPNPLAADRRPQAQATAPGAVGRPEAANAAGSALEDAIARVWASVLGAPHVLRDDDFFMLGGDSIRAIQIASRLRRLGVKVDVQDLFQHPSVAALAAAVGSHAAAASVAEATGQASLTPIQRWFLAFAGGDAHPFNQVVGLRSTENLCARSVRGALEALWRHHDGLRMAVATDGSDRFVVPQVGDGASGPVLLEVDLVGDDAQSQLGAHVQRLHDVLRLDGPGPLFGAVLARTVDGDRVVLAAHHFVVDRVSWDILLEDFEMAYEALSCGQEVLLPFKGTPVVAHARFLQRLADEAALGDMRRYASTLAADEPPLSPRRVHHARDMRTVEAVIDADVSQRLLDLAGRIGQHLDTVLLAALGIALRDSLGRQHTLVDLESHGRTIPQRLASFDPSIDLTRTVGWFTAFAPVRLTAEAGDTLEDVAALLQRRREAVPDDGWSFGLVQGQPAAAAGLGRPLVHAQVGFNHLGTLAGSTSNGRFEVDWAPPGEPIGAGTGSPHALELLTLVADGCIEVTLTGDTTALDGGTLDAVLRGLVGALMDAAGASGAGAAADAPGFSHAITADELDDLLGLD